MLAADLRFKKRMPCRVNVDGDSCGGLVLNISRGGVYVQTSARAEPGAEVWLELQSQLPHGSIQVGAQVVWKRVVDARLRGVASGGVGLKIRTAPESYYALLMALSRAGDPGRGAAPAPARIAAAAPEQSYRVRLKLKAGSRTRTLTIRAGSAHEAGRRALASAGPGWAVLESIPI